MAKRTSVVISQSPSQNPARRALEEDIVAALLMEPGIDVTIIPSLYDLTADSTGMLALHGIPGTMVMVTWLFPRAAHWILDRNQIRGQFGTTLMAAADADAEDDDDEEESAEAIEKPRVIDERPIPERKIYCLDLRATNRSADFIAEIKRIHQENNVQLVGLSGLNGHAKSLPIAANLTAANGQTAKPDAIASVDGVPQVQRIDDAGARRWYPVIDYSRCTNCMECIDFCLFGVYGTDRLDTILVEQPDNCRKGCPACSRVCPENAILFPHHKTPAIAGSPEIGASLKIDLSELFGAPEQGKSAVEVAALERDEQLQLAGRAAVGMTVGIHLHESNGAPSNGQAKKAASSAPAPIQDELDVLMAKVDELDL